MRAVLPVLYLALPLACGRAEVFTSPAPKTSCGDLDLCDAVCVDIQSDPAHCGGCKIACRSDQVCVLGDCVLGPCGPGLVDCDGACADLRIDEVHCGQCGHACAAGELCMDATCATDCGDLENCGGTCIDTSADPLHCGFCFNSCDRDDVCVQSTCSCDDPDACNYCGVIDLPSTAPQTVFGTLFGENQSVPSCAIDGPSDALYRFQAPVTAVYELVVNGFVSALFVLDAATCRELGCGASPPNVTVQVALDAAQEVLVVVDGNPFENFSLTLDQL